MSRSRSTNKKAGKKAGNKASKKTAGGARKRAAPKGRKPKSAARGDSVSAGGPVGAIARRWKPIALSALTLVGTGAAVWGVIEGLTLMTARAQAAMLDRPGTGEVRFDWPTIADGRTWLAETDQSALIAFAERALAGGSGAADRGAGDAGAGGDQPLSDVPLARLREALLTSKYRGWFRGEPRVVRSREDGSVRVVADWRVPGAVVRAGGRDHLVSWSGMPMPRTFDRDGSDQPVILGPAQSPGRYEETWRRYAEPWPGADVGAGLGLLAELHRAGLIDLIYGVDVGPVSAGGDLILRTRHGASLVWGGPVGAFRPGQAEDAVRLARVREAVAYLDELASNGRIDEARAARIDISGLVAEIDGTPAGGALDPSSPSSPSDSSSAGKAGEAGTP